MIRRLAPVLAFLDVILVLVAQPLYPPGQLDLTAAILFPLTTASFGVAGSLLAIRVPGNRIGSLLLAAGTLLAIGVFSGAWATASVAHGGSWPGTLVAASITNVAFVPPIIIVAVGVPLVFPDGHLLSPRWRIVAWAAAIGTAFAGAHAAFRPGPISNTIPIENPLAQPALQPLLELLNTAAVVAVGPVLVAAAAACLVRFRRGTTIERQQLKWLLAVTAAAALSFTVGFLGPAGPVQDAGWILGFVCLAALPVAIGIAILRYRLYEIDRIVSRTIGWALVTAGIAAVFPAAVIGLQTLLAGVTNGRTLAVAASTLLAFALFQPVQRRVQRAVDRRFHRARYDAERMLAAFSAELRDELDLATLRVRLSSATTGAVEPARVDVWLRGATKRPRAGAP